MSKAKSCLLRHSSLFQPVDWLSTALYLHSPALSQLPPPRPFSPQFCSALFCGELELATVPRTKLELEDLEKRKVEKREKINTHTEAVVLESRVKKEARTKRRFCGSYVGLFMFYLLFFW